MIIINYT